VASSNVEADFVRSVVGVNTINSFPKGLKPEIIRKKNKLSTELIRILDFDYG
jgi:hypothetical protein